jgi:hypothetical protein
MRLPIGDECCALLLAENGTRRSHGNAIRPIIAATTPIRRTEVIVTLRVATTVASELMA